MSTTNKWLGRPVKRRLDELVNEPRSGKPLVIGVERVKQVIISNLKPRPQSPLTGHGQRCPNTGAADLFDQRDLEAILGAKRRGECDGLTGLPETSRDSRGPTPWSPPAQVPPGSAPLDAFVSFQNRRCVAAALKADLHRPEPGVRLETLADFSDSKAGPSTLQKVVTRERA